LDGGLDIPHSEKRFAGFSKEDKSLNAETHPKYILGGHIADYMKVQFLSFQAAITSPSTTFRWNFLWIILSFTHKKVSRGNNTDSLWGDGLQLLKEEEPEKYHFSGLLKEGFEADDLAEMYTSVHAAIHADPSAQLTKKNAPTEKKMWVAASWYSFTKLWLHPVPYLYTLVVFCFWGLSAGQVQ